MIRQIKVIKVGREVRRDCNRNWWQKCNRKVEKRLKLQWVAEELGKMRSPRLLLPFQTVVKRCA